MSRCEKYMEMASLLLDGELPDGCKAGLFEHLESCDECRAFYETMKAASASLGCVSAPEGFTKSVMDAVGAAAAEKKAETPAPSKRPRRRALAARAAGLAACLVLIAAAGIKLAGGEAPTAPAEAAPAGFDYTGAETEGVRGAEEPAAEPAEEPAQEPRADGENSFTINPASTDDCIGGLTAATVTAGESVMHTADPAALEEIAEVLGFAAEAEAAPEGEPDYLVELECGEAVYDIEVYAVDGTLVCVRAGREPYVAAGSAGQMREIA